MNTNRNPLKSKSKGKNAFTLIELIVVVGIIALIVAIAIPALNSSKADSQQRSAEARAKVLNEARDRAILKELGSITTREQWDTNWGTGSNAATDAAAFLISNGLIRVNDL